MKPLAVPWDVAHCAEKIMCWHSVACDRFGPFVQSLGAQWRAPELTLELDVINAAGRYWHADNRCEYRLAYCAAYGHVYEQTVIHEVCHAAQRQLMPRCQKHGDFFRFLMRRVGKVEPDRCHPYDPRLAHRVSLLLLMTTPDVGAAIDLGLQRTGLMV